MFVTLFSADINAQMECIELQSDIQLEEKFIQEFFLDFCKLSQEN